MSAGQTPRNREHFPHMKDRREGRRIRRHRAAWRRARRPDGSYLMRIGGRVIRIGPVYVQTIPSFLAYDHCPHCSNFNVHWIELGRPGETTKSTWRDYLDPVRRHDVGVFRECRSCSRRWPIIAGVVEVPPEPEPACLSVMPSVDGLRSSIWRCSDDDRRAED